jgi:hypothetical protein
MHVCYKPLNPQFTINFNGLHYVRRSLKSRELLVCAELLFSLCVHIETQVLKKSGELYKYECMVTRSAERSQKLYITVK